jgi:hypothetical protein
MRQDNKRKPKVAKKGMAIVKDKTVKEKAKINIKKSQHIVLAFFMQ